MHIYGYTLMLGGCFFRNRKLALIHVVKLYCCLVEAKPTSKAVACQGQMALEELKVLAICDSVAKARKRAT